MGWWAGAVYEWGFCLLDGGICSTRGMGLKYRSYRQAQIAKFLLKLHSPYILFKKAASILHCSVQASNITSGSIGM